MFWEKIRKNIIALYKNERLSITIENNIFETDFFDGTINLVTGKFSPFRKKKTTSHFISTRPRYLNILRLSENLGTVTTQIHFPIGIKNKTKNFQNTSGHARQRHQLHRKMEHRSLYLNMQMWLKKV